MAAPKFAPAWAKVFLDALARTGNVRVSAEQAGVDATSVYNRRSRCAEFRDAWGRVLGEREARASSLDERGFCDAPDDSAGNEPVVRDAPGGTPRDEPVLRDPPGGAAQGERIADELVVRTTATGVKLARVGSRRWGQGAEELFLGELAASANVKRAAAAAGFSPEAVYKRRLRQHGFAAAWDAAIAVGKARLEAMLVAAAERSFDPETLPLTGLDERRVSVGEALHILKLKGGATPVGAGSSTSLGAGVGGGSEMSEEAVDALRARIARKLEKLKAQVTAARLTEGWSEHDGELIPPGWVRAGA